MIILVTGILLETVLLLRHRSGRTTPPPARGDRQRGGRGPPEHDRENGAEEIYDVKAAGVWIPV
jgi:hypothetical protein